MLTPDPRGLITNIIVISHRWRLWMTIACSRKWLGVVCMGTVALCLKKALKEDKQLRDK
jgi:hypothetical protein